MPNKTKPTLTPIGENQWAVTYPTEQRDHKPRQLNEAPKPRRKTRKRFVYGNRRYQTEKAMHQAIECHASRVFVLDMAQIAA